MSKPFCSFFSSIVFDSAGMCSCKPGVGGAKCDSCLDKSDWWNGKQCTSCDCYEYLEKCKNIDGKYKSLTDVLTNI